MMIDFIDKRKFFGKKTGLEAPGVAPKTSGTVKGKWVWYRSREENSENIKQQRLQDRMEYQSATDVEKQQRMFLLKTGAINLPYNKEDFAINNVRNRVEMANSWLLNHFLGRGSAVENTIAYSTYYKEQNSYSDKYYIDENGYIKEELASQYSGQFDTPKGKKTTDYNKEKLQELNFVPLRKAFVVCGLMGFHDFLGNYDNFAFVKNKFMITDTGVGSGNTGQHSTYVRAGKTNFDVDVLSDFDKLFKGGDQELVSEFRNHLTVEDVLKGIEELKLKGLDELEAILNESFKPVPNPFEKHDKRYDKFVEYNEALQSHKEQLYEAYNVRFEKLIVLQQILNKFYPNHPEQYHVSSFVKLVDIHNKLEALQFPDGYYKIYVDANEKLLNLEKKGLLTTEEDELHSTLRKIINEFNQKDINGEDIDTLLYQVSQLEEEIDIKEKVMQQNKENLGKFDEIIKDLAPSLPKNLRNFLSNPQLQTKDPTKSALIKLAQNIDIIRESLPSGKSNLQEAKLALIDAMQQVIKVSGEEFEKTTLGKTRSVLGFPVQFKKNDLNTSLEKFMDSKHFSDIESKHFGKSKKGLVDLPELTDYKKEIKEMKETKEMKQGITPEEENVKDEGQHIL